MADTCSVCGLHPYDGHGYVSTEPEWHANER